MTKTVTEVATGASTSESEYHTDTWDSVTDTLITIPPTITGITIGGGVLTIIHLIITHLIIILTLHTIQFTQYIRATLHIILRTILEADIIRADLTLAVRD